MPIQIVYKNRIKYYRWGNRGKLYKTREKAEKQARAIIISQKENSKPNE